MNNRDEFASTVKKNDFIEVTIIDGSMKSGKVTEIEKDYFYLQINEKDCWPLAFSLIKTYRKLDHKTKCSENDICYGYIIDKKIIRNGDELGFIKCCNDNREYKFKGFNIKDDELSRQYDSFDKDTFKDILVKFCLKKINQAGSDYGADKLVTADLIHDEIAKGYKEQKLKPVLKSGPNNLLNGINLKITKPAVIVTDSILHYGFLLSKSLDKNVGMVQSRGEDGTIQKYRLIAANIMDKDLAAKFGSYSDYSDYFHDHLLKFEIGQFESNNGLLNCAVNVVLADCISDENAKEYLNRHNKYTDLDNQMNLVKEWMTIKGNLKDEEAYESIQDLLNEENRNTRKCELIDRLLVIALRARDDIKKKRLDEVKILLEENNELIKRESYLDSLVKIALTKLYDKDWSYQILETAIAEAATIQNKLQNITNVVSFINNLNSLDNKGREKELAEKYIQYIEIVKENPNYAEGKSGQFFNSCYAEYLQKLAGCLRNMEEKNICIDPVLYDKAKIMIESDETAYSLYNGNDMVHFTISDMVSDILKNTLLPDEINGNTVPKNKDGQYTGTLEQAVRLLPAGGEKEADCALSQEEYWVISAKMYFDLMNAGILESINILKTFCPNIAKYLTQKGDSIKLDNDKTYLDMARTYYLECINYPCYEYILENAVIQILLSYLATRSNWNKQYDRLQGFGDKLIHIDSEYKENDYLVCALLGVMDTIKSSRTTQKYNQIKERIFSGTFIPGNWKLASNVYDSLRKFYNKLPDSCESAEELAESFEIVLEQYQVYKNDFIHNVNEFKNNFNFTINGIIAAGGLVKEWDSFYKYMLETDKKRYDQFLSIIDEVKSFNSRSDIKKMNILVEVLNALADQIQEVKKKPTLTAYTLIPAMVKLKMEADRKLDELYQEEEKYPKIKYYVVGENDLYKESNDELCLRIFVYNEEGCQDANDLMLTVTDTAVENNEVRNVYQDERCIRLLNGSGVTFVVKLSALKTDKLSFNINIRYSFYASLYHVKENHITEKVKLTVRNGKFTPISNPYKGYAGGLPVQDEAMFFGRQKLISDIMEQLQPKNKIQSPYGRTIVLFGQKRTGKSSVKYHIISRLRNIPNTLILDTKEISLFLHESFEAEFFKTILNQLRREIKKHPELELDMKENNIFIPRISSNDKQEVWSSFIEFYDQFSEYIKSRPFGEEFHIYLIADEFTKLYIWMKQGFISQSFMELWKSFFGTCAISAIVVGQDYMPRFAKEYANSFATMNIYEVTYLSEDAVKEMMTNAPLSELSCIRADYDHPAGYEARKRFMELTAGNAYIGMNFLNKLMDYLNETKRIQVTEFDVNQAMNRLLSETNVELLFDAIFGDDSDVNDPNRPIDNKTILRQIAKAEGSTCQEEDIVDFEPERRKDLLKYLTDRKVICRNTKTGKFSIVVKLYNEWLKRQ